MKAMTTLRKPLIWLHGEVKTPPFSRDARVEAGTLLKKVQEGDSLQMPHSEPMPSIGARCHQLRVRDETKYWRIVYRVDHDAILIVEVYPKTTQQTPKHFINVCRQRLKRYDDRVAKTKKRG